MKAGYSAKHLKYQIESEGGRSKIAFGYNGEDFIRTDMELFEFKQQHVSELLSLMQ